MRTHKYAGVEGTAQERLKSLRAFIDDLLSAKPMDHACDCCGKYAATVRFRADGTADFETPTPADHGVCEACAVSEWVYQNL